MGYTRVIGVRARKKEKGQYGLLFGVAIDE